MKKFGFIAWICLCACWGVSCGDDDTLSYGELLEEYADWKAENEQKTESTYVLNTNTKKFHLPSCSSLNQMNESNKGEFTGTRDELIQQGYEPCKRCHP